jgi:hypothetical protein
MEIVRVTEAHELAAEDQRFCEATKAWFTIDFVPKMSRVLLTVPEFGRPPRTREKGARERWRASRRSQDEGGAAGAVFLYPSPGGVARRDVTEQGSRSRHVAGDASRELWPSKAATKLRAYSACRLTDARNPAPFTAAIICSIAT